MRRSSEKTNDINWIRWILDINKNLESTHKAPISDIESLWETWNKYLKMAFCLSKHLESNTLDSKIWGSFGIVIYKNEASAAMFPKEFQPDGWDSWDKYQKAAFCVAHAFDKKNSLHMFLKCTSYNIDAVNHYPKPLRSEMWDHWGVVERALYCIGDGLKNGITQSESLWALLGNLCIYTNTPLHNIHSSLSGLPDDRDTLSIHCFTNAKNISHKPHDQLDYQIIIDELLKKQSELRKNVSLRSEIKTMQTKLFGGPLKKFKAETKQMSQTFSSARIQAPIQTRRLMTRHSYEEWLGKRIEKENTSLKDEINTYYHMQNK